MTTIISFTDETYCDSLHVVKIESGEDSLVRKPKIRIINPHAAFAISGVAILPPAVDKAMVSELDRISKIIYETGLANNEDTAVMDSFINNDVTILLILRHSRWYINSGKITYIPETADITMGTGSNHYNSLRFKRDEITREELMARIAVMDEYSSGPWIRLRHEVLEG